MDTMKTEAAPVRVTFELKMETNSDYGEVMRQLAALALQVVFSGRHMVAAETAFAHVNGTWSGRLAGVEQLKKLHMLVEGWGPLQFVAMVCSEGRERPVETHTFNDFAELDRWLDQLQGRPPAFCLSYGKTVPHLPTLPEDVLNCTLEKWWNYHYRGTELWLLRWVRKKHRELQAENPRGQMVYVGDLLHHMTVKQMRAEKDIGPHRVALLCQVLALRGLQLGEAGDWKPLPVSPLK